MEKTSIGPNRTPEANARELAETFGWPQEGVLRLLMGGGSEAEAEAIKASARHQ